MINRETCRKRYVAASIDQKLIDVFPDCEGLPNGFYAKLAKIEKQLIKDNGSINKFISSLNLNQVINDESTVEDKQRSILLLMESKLKKSFDKISWKTSYIAKYDDKKHICKNFQKVLITVVLKLN